MRALAQIDAWGVPARILAVALATFFCPRIWAQTPTPVYEQIALDFFANVVLQNDTLLKGYNADYDGWVDSSITTIPTQIYLRHQDDSLIVAAYRMTRTADNDFWLNNVKPPFQLTVPSPIHKRIKSSYSWRSQTARPTVFHHLLLGDKVYVWMRTMVGSGDRGVDYYLTLDQSGQVLNFDEIHFIF